MSLARSGHLEVVVSSAEARFDCVAELWSAGEMVATTEVDDGEFMLSIVPRSNGGSRLVSVAALVEALAEAERLLAPPTGRTRDATRPPVEAKTVVGGLRAAIRPAVRSPGRSTRVPARLVGYLARRRRRTTAMTLSRRVARGDRGAKIAASAVEPGSVISLGSDDSIRVMVTTVTERDGTVVLEGTNEINGTEVRVRTAPGRLVVCHGQALDADARTPAEARTERPPQAT
jgi:hypothetical protein